jgi:hypothetical protein
MITKCPDCGHSFPVPNCPSVALAKDRQYIADLEAENRILRATEKNVDYEAKWKEAQAEIVEMQNYILRMLTDIRGDAMGILVDTRELYEKIDREQAGFCIKIEEALAAQEAQPAPVIDMPPTGAGVEATAERLLDMCGLAGPGLPPIAAQEIES